MLCDNDVNKTVNIAWLLYTKADCDVPFNTGTIQPNPFKVMWSWYDKAPVVDLLWYCVTEASSWLDMLVTKSL